MKTSQIVLLLVTSLACSRAELPFGMKPCARNATDLNTCVLKMARDTMSYILGGHWKLHDKIDPFPFENFKSDVNGDDIVLYIVGKDVLWHGLSATAINNLRFDLNEKKMSFDLSIPSMKVDGTCAVNGHIDDLEIQADGESFPLATILYRVAGEFSAHFNFNLEMKTNASGTFLVPVMSSYTPQLNIGTVTLENIFRVGYVPDQPKVDLLKKAEDISARVLRDFLVNLLGQLVASITPGILQMDTYDQFFPWTVSAGSVPALTGGWLVVLLIIGTSTLLKSI